MADGPRAHSSPDGPLTRERILEAAEEVLRRYGPGKAMVVDVARALGVSHGSVYRHFPSKAALRDAVAERWLARVSGPLQAVAASDEPPPQRLQRWLRTLSAMKRSKATGDPELFATYLGLVSDAREVVRGHVDLLTAQLARIVADGVASGDFTVDDADAAARAVFSASARFHNPAHAGEWSAPGVDAALEELMALLLRGLQARSG